MRQVDHFIVADSPAPTRKAKIWNPSTGEVQAEVPLAGRDLLDTAIETAKRVQPQWAATNPQKRARVMFKYKELVEANMQSLAELLSSEHGKTVPDAMGDVQRGLEVIEYACGIPQVLKGEYWRRDYPVQLSRHDPDVDVWHGVRCGQCVHPETVRARPIGACAFG